MPIVRMDEKGRIQLPREVRSSWRLKPRQPLLLNIGRDQISVTKLAKPTPQTDPLLRDIVERPLRTKAKITRKLLEKIEDEMWNP